MANIVIRLTEELDRNFWTNVGDEVKRIKSLMRPLLSNWLMESVDGKAMRCRGL